MNLPAFLLITIAFMLMDGVLTLALWAASGFDIVSARLLSVAITLPCVAYTLKRLQRSAPVGGVLMIIVSIVSKGVSFGIFALILSRNPFVQWPVAFVAASCASLALAAAGYLRTRKRLDRRL